MGLCLAGFGWRCVSVCCIVGCGFFLLVLLCLVFVICCCVVLVWWVGVGLYASGLIVL